uniref:Integrase catalytic domain-containing protein n=1 Tax=Strigamia maritima TaxID=126957 RepID=T1IJK4_STRMM
MSTPGFKFASLARGQNQRDVCLLGKCCLPDHDISSIPSIVDFYGPKPKSTGGHTYAFVMVDAATRWLDVRLTNSSDARTSIHQITKFCQRWGFPKTIVSDNAPSFRSFEFQSKCRQMGATNHYTAAYHPQPNLAERLNQSLKSCILAYIDDHTRWDLHIGFFVLAINTAYQISLKYSPYQMVVGQEARYPGDIDSDTDDGEPLPPSVAENLHLHMTQMRERAVENLKKAQIQHKRWFDVHRRTHDFQPGDWVMLKNRQLSSTDRQFAAGLRQRTKGVYIIHKIVGPNTFILMDEKGQKTRPYNVIDIRKWFYEDDNNLTPTDVSVIELHVKNYINEVFDIFDAALDAKLP